MLSRNEIEERLAWRDDIGRPGYSENEGEALQTAQQLYQENDELRSIVHRLASLFEYEGQDSAQEWEELNELWLEAKEWEEKHGKQSS